MDKFIVEFLQQTVNGLQLGGIYALIALGYTMVYGIVRLINFAHGDVLMLGAYFGFFVLQIFGVSPFSVVLAFGISMVLAALVGMGIERFAYRPLRQAPRINSLITAIGVSLLIENICRVLPRNLGPREWDFKFFGPDYWTFPNILSGSINVGGVAISFIQILVISVSVVLMIGLMYLVNRTKMGKAMRAVSHDLGAASLMGIPVNRTIATTFAIGSALAAAGGMLFAMTYGQIDPNMGILPGLKAFVAAVLGGIGSIPGALLGGVLMGLVETYTIGFISSLWANAVVFGILVIILLVKPTGLMGTSHKEKV